MVKNIVDHNDKSVHKQTVKQIFREVKNKILVNLKRGVPYEHLQSYPDFFLLFIILVLKSIFNFCENFGKEV